MQALGSYYFSLLGGKFSGEKGKKRESAEGEREKEGEERRERERKRGGNDCTYNRKKRNIYTVILSIIIRHIYIYVNIFVNINSCGHNLMLLRITREECYNKVLPFSFLGVFYRHLSLSREATEEIKIISESYVSFFQLALISV